MAFDNVTFFEVHLDGANIGPTFGADEAGDDEPEMDEEMRMDEEMEMEMGEETDAEQSRGRGRLVAVLALVAVAGMAAVVRRRRNATDGDDEGIEIESVDVTESTDAVAQ